jgi:hypothetical protein
MNAVWLRWRGVLRCHQHSSYTLFLNNSSSPTFIGDEGDSVIVNVQVLLDLAFSKPTKINNPKQELVTQRLRHVILSRYGLRAIMAQRPVDGTFPPQLCAAFDAAPQPLFSSRLRNAMLSGKSSLIRERMYSVRHLSPQYHSEVLFRDV